MFATSAYTPKLVTKKEVVDCDKTEERLSSLLHQTVHRDMSSTFSVQCAPLSTGPEEVELVEENSQEVLQQLQEDLVLDPDDIAGVSVRESHGICGSASDGCASSVKCGKEGRVVRTGTTGGGFTESDAGDRKDGVVVKPLLIQSTCLQIPSTKHNSHASGINPPKREFNQSIVSGTKVVDTEDVDGGRVDVFFCEKDANCGSCEEKEAEMVWGDVVDLVSGDGDLCEGGGGEQEEIEGLEKSQLEFDNFMEEFTSPDDFLSKVRRYMYLNSHCISK